MAMIVDAQKTQPISSTPQYNLSSQQLFYHGHVIRKITSSDASVLLFVAYFILHNPYSCRMSSLFLKHQVRVTIAASVRDGWLIV